MDTKSLIAAPLIGIITLGFGAYLLNDSMSITRNYIETTATVTSIKKVSDYYHTYIRFTTASGLVVNTDFGSGKDSPNYFTGSQISIYYDPNNPSNIRYNDFVIFWAVPIVVIFLGSLFLINTPVYLWRQARERSSPRTPVSLCARA